MLIFDICITIAWSTLPRMILLFSEMHHLAGVSISIIPSILHLFSYFSLGSNAYLLFVLCISIFGIASKPDSSSSSPVLSLAFQRKKKSGLDLFLLPQALYVICLIRFRFSLPPHCSSSPFPSSSSSQFEAALEFFNFSFFKLATCRTHQTSNPGKPTKYLSLFACSH